MHCLHSALTVTDFHLYLLNMAGIPRPEQVNELSTETVSALQENDINNSVDDVAEDGEDNFEVTMVDNSRFSTSFHVANHYIGYIIGRKGATKMRIERETQTSIAIPKLGEAGDISILGPTKANVSAARSEIKKIVIFSRSKQGITHFNSIPMNTPEIMKNFEIFKDRVLKETSSRGIEEVIFSRTEKLHLTIGVMSLMDDEEIMIASKLLEEAREKIILPLLREHSPLRIRVKDLAYMNNDPKQINVLYARVYEEDGNEGVLQTLADKLVDFFCKTEYMDRHRNKREHVTLHVTLLNTKHRLRSGDVRIKRVSFDGSEILERFANYDFGVHELSEIHLSQCDTAREDGYWVPTCVISCKE